jgi:hypothetical protein
LLWSAFLEPSIEDEAVPETKKPPLREAAWASRSIGLVHMPKGAASGLESGIIAVGVIFGTFLIMKAI